MNEKRTSLQFSGCIDPTRVDDIANIVDFILEQGSENARALAARIVGKEYFELEVEYSKAVLLASQLSRVGVSVDVSDPPPQLTSISPERYHALSFRWGIPALVLLFGGSFVQGYGYVSLSSFDLSRSAAISWIVVGVVIETVGRILLVVGLAHYARAKGRHPAWGFLGLLGFVGFIALAFLRDDSRASRLKSIPDESLEPVLRSLRGRSRVSGAPPLPAEIHFVCPHCQIEWVIDAQFAGQRGPCRGCHREVTVPKA